MRKFKLILIITLCLNSAFSWCKQTLFLGVVPQQSAKVLATKWTPLVNHLSLQTGLKLKFVTAKDIPTFEKRLAKKTYHFAYMNPYHFVHFNETASYQAVAKQKDKRIKGILVVRKDASFQELADLQGQRLAFPAPAAFAASILTRAALQEHNVDFSPQYVSSHDSVYLNVAKGIFSAGGGVLRTFQLAPAHIKNQLKVFYTTNGFTPHALAASDSVDSETIIKVQQALIELAASPQGEQILKGINIGSFEVAQNSDWDDVRQLHLSTLFAND